VVCSSISGVSAFSCFGFICRHIMLMGPESTYVSPKINNAMDGCAAIKISIKIAVTNTLKFIFLNSSGFLKLLYFMLLTIKNARAYNTTSIKT